MTSLTSKRNSARGFTLIELLVVIAIIGLLSSVVLASLNTARAKGRDAAIKSEVLELRTLYSEQFADTGSDAVLQVSAYGGWVSNPSNPSYSAYGCSGTSPSGTYASQFLQVCTALISNETPTCGPSAYACLLAGSNQPGGSNLNPVGADDPTRFSIMAWLPGAQTYICVGSDGTSFDPGTNNNTAFTGTGCYYNP